MAGAAPAPSRLFVVAGKIRREHGPGLLPARPEVCARLQSGNVVERARLDALPVARRVVDPDPAVRTERARLHPTAVRTRLERLEGSRDELEGRLGNDQAHPEGTARLPLAVAAVADGESDGLRNDPVSNLPALTSTRGAHTHAPGSRPFAEDPRPSSQDPPGGRVGRVLARIQPALAVPSPALVDHVRRRFTNERAELRERDGATWRDLALASVGKRPGIVLHDLSGLVVREGPV